MTVGSVWKTPMGEEVMFRTDTVGDACRLCMEDAYGGGSDV